MKTNWWGTLRWPIRTFWSWFISMGIISEVGNSDRLCISASAIATDFVYPPMQSLLDICSRNDHLGWCKTPLPHSPKQIHPKQDPKQQSSQNWPPQADIVQPQANFSNNRSPSKVKSILPQTNIINHMTPSKIPKQFHCYCQTQLPPLRKNYAHPKQIWIFSSPQAW